MKILTFFFIASFTIFKDFYLIIPALTFANLSLLTILFIFFTYRSEINRFHQSISQEDQKNLKKILKIAFIFIITIFIINLIHKVSLLYSIKTILIQSAITLSLPLFNFIYYQKKINFLKFINFIIFVHFFFVVLQLIGLNVNLSSIFIDNPIIGVFKTEEFYKETLRVTGAINNTISLSHQFIAFTCISIITFINKKNLFNFTILSICIITIIFAQSRAVIFAFIPLIYLSSFIFLKFEIKKFFYLIIILSLAYYSYNFFLPTLQSYFSYTFKELNLSDTHRFWTNLYISQGVFKESPLIGIKADLAWNIFDQYKDPYYDIYDIQRDATPTHHNQLFYYFRYYGLIGLTILILTYFRIFASIKNLSNKNVSFMIGSIIIIDLFFSLTHNNKIFSPMLWIYLSLIFNSDNQKNNL